MRTNKTHTLKSRHGFKSEGLDVDAAAAELSSLESQGRLTREDALEAARSPASALHSAIDWDKNVASRQWQLHQVGCLIRAIIPIEKGEDRPVPLFVRVTSDGSPRYMNTTTVVRERDLYESALEGLVAELESAKRSVEELKWAAEKSKSKHKTAQAAKVQHHVDSAINAARGVPRKTVARQRRAGATARG